MTVKFLELEKWLLMILIARLASTTCALAMAQASYILLRLPRDCL